MTKYADWIRYFEQNRWPELKWVASLTAEEREAVTPSLRQFQLGENSDGRTLLRLGREFAEARGEGDYPRSLELFVKEEQRHAAMLGRLLDVEGIARLQEDRVDGVFRWMRKLWRHELMVSVLVAAECVAVPYYSALHDATRSPLLRAICRQVLRDEAMHLAYQGQTLAKLGAGRGFWAASVTRTLHRLLVLAATLVVYGQHRRLWRKAGWPLQDAVASAFQALGQVEKRLPGNAMVGIGWTAPTRRGVGIA